MQHVSTYNSHLRAKLRTVIALQGGCGHLGSHMACGGDWPVTPARRVSYRGTEAQPNPPLHQGNRQPPHKTKNEAQPPHKTESRNIQK